MGKIAIIIVAPPCGGKGTQSQNIVLNYGFHHLSTGDLLRSSVPDLKNLMMMNSGRLVDDFFVSYLLKDKLSHCHLENVIFDGFPRNLNQLNMFQNLLDQHQFIQVIPVFLDVSDKILEKRLEERKKVNLRPDDHLEIFRGRIRSFRIETLPVIDHFKEHQNFIQIDVNNARITSHQVWIKLNELLFPKIATILS